MAIKFKFDPKVVAREGAVFSPKMACRILDSLTISGYFY